VQNDVNFSPWMLALIEHTYILLKSKVDIKTLILDGVGFFVIQPRTYL